MNLCSEGHEEICYCGNLCPACQLNEELTDMQTEYESRINELLSEIDQLKEDKE